MPKIRHGSVSQIAIDELIGDYVTGIHQEISGDSLHRNAQIYEEICRRIGTENAEIAIGKMLQVYSLMTGQQEDPDHADRTHFRSIAL